ncbi:hypothetical protein [Profundibacter sp.]
MRFVGILILIFIPAMGMAQRVIVRSGEHTDFSRLAFEFSDTVEWEMGRVEAGYEIRIHGVGSEIDISKVYQRITHERIKNLTVSADNSRIMLDLGCDCHADAFEFRPGLLVVDVKEGLPPVPSRFEADFNSGELSESQKSNTAVIEQVTQNAPESLREKPVAALPLRLPIEHVPANLYSEQFGGNSDVEPEAPTNVVEMQSEILRQISRAASQGLLNANVPHPIQAKSNDHKAGEISEDLTALPSPKPHINIHIENSIDREFASLAERIEMTGTGSKCLPDALFNISEWGDEGSILAKISEQRSIVSGEFDTPDKEAVLGLVKAYIYAGFGAEALSVLSLFDLGLEGNDTLVAMAQVVDDGTSGYHVKFTDQIGCDTASALWAALYVPTLSKQASINKASILGNFSQLPAHLRKLLGPGLAQKFLNIGDLDTARALRNAIARSPGDAGSEYILLNAKLDRVRGLTETVERTLEDIIVTDSSAAPRALIELLEIKLQKREQVEPQIFATAESYIFEQQGTKVAAELQRLIVLILGQSGDFNKALHALYELETYESLEIQTIAATWESVVENLAMNASEASLLKFVFSAKDQLIHQHISRMVRRKLALRLLEGGWPVQAEMVLAAPQSPTTDDQVILARVEIQIGKAENVLERLENVAGDEAAKLRAMAYEGSEMYLDAAQEYGVLEDDEKQVIAVWRAEDWSQLAIIGSKADRAAANLMLSKNLIGGEPTTTISGTIAHDSSLLIKSEAARDSIEQLLEEYPILANEAS